MKECLICKKEKALTEFNKTKGDSYHSYCKPCMSIYKKQKIKEGYKPPKATQKPRMLQLDNYNGLF